MGHPAEKRNRVIVVAAFVAMLAIAGLWFGFGRREPAAIARETLAYSPPPLGEVAPARALTKATNPEPAAPATAPAETEVDRALGPPRWHARPEGEWDGMLVNLNVTPPCESPAGCGMARACKNGKCMPCEVDVDCASGESCVLDHCVKSANVSCRRRADCASGSVCILSGYSSGIRGNENMRAFCLAILSGADQLPPAPENPPKKDSRTEVPDDELLQAASKARQQ